MSAISVSSEELENIANSLETASAEYKSNLNKLTGLINQITSGEIKGVIADDLRSKYEAKMDTFQQLNNVIDEAEKYMQNERNEFNRVMSELQSDMR